MGLNGRLFAGVAVATLFGSGSAWAQEVAAPAAQPAAAEATEAAPEEGGIADIVVTARRRNESVQNTPIAITAMSGEALANRQVTSLTSLSSMAPALTINSSSAFSGSSQTVAIFMRGIGQTDFTLNTDPGVGIYVDNVYISRSVGALLDLVDLDRVEVLRGPQGTLFGRNSVGGAISITTARPAKELGGKVAATYGSDNQVILTGSLNAPLSTTLFSKLTVQYNRRDGYVRRLVDGKKMGNKNNLSARFSMLWEPDGQTEALFNADYSRSRENGTPLILTAVDSNAPFVAAHNLIVAPQIDPNLNNFPGGCYNPAGAAATASACYDSRWILADRNTTAASFPAYSNADIWGVGLTVSHDLSDAFKIKSITAYRKLNSEFSRDSDGSPLEIGSTSDVFNYHQFSQELQLSGNLLDDRLNMIVGGFFFDEKGHNPNIVSFGFVNFLSGGDVHNTSLAGFGQATFKATSNLSLTAGLRYTDEKKRFTPNQYVLAVPYAVPFFPPFLQFTPGQRLTTTQTQVANAGEWTPYLNASVRFSNNAMVYASYSRGFKSGGFTQRIFPALPTPPSFGPETVLVYEAGFKLDVLDRHLRLNGAGYLTDYNDLQITVPVGAAPTTQNAAEARIKGFELEATAIPFDGLTATFSAGYVNAYYRSLDARVSPTITRSNLFPGTSKWTLNGTLSYEAQIGGGWTATPLVDWSYRSQFFFDAENLVGQPGYHLIDASLTFANKANGLTLAIFGKNLGDKFYALHGEQILNPVGFQMISPTRGREWGVRVAKSF